MNYLKTTILLALLAGILVWIGFMLGGTQGAVIALAVSAAINLFAFFKSDAIVLRMHNARQVSRADAPDYYDLVEQLAQNAGLPTPRIYLIEADQPNAFAAGSSPKKGVVAITTGLLRQLDRRELAGVISHELAHIKNRDTLIMVVAATVAGAISMVAQYALFFSRGDRRGGIIASLLIMILAPLAATLVQLAISRTREYAADRMGAQISGDPLGLASALEKISLATARNPLPSAERNPASAHLFIANPLSAKRGISSLFSTHPDPALRIEALREMAATAEIRNDQRKPGKLRKPVPTVRRRGQDSWR